MPNTSLKAKRTVGKVVRFILTSLIALVILTQIGLSILVMVAGRPVDSSVVRYEQLITINQGMTGNEIGRVLEERGIIRSRWLFSLLLRLTNADNKLQAGEYLFVPEMNMFGVIERLLSGRSVTYSVTIPEGYEIEQIASLLADKELIDEQRFIFLAHNADLVGENLLPFDLPINSLEGYVFPDTYQFVRDQSEEAIIHQMVSRFVEYVLPKIDLGLLDSKYSLHEVITLASIVEKEVIMDWERPIVAAVYLNRLDANMRLQADPTVRYVMSENRSRVLYSDLEIDSPYNTYRYDGLPPGPIASPGIESIMAVLESADVDYLFFVSKRDGTHHFSRTFNEHVAARRELGY